ncbi:MAG: hypothetical protein JO075_12485 [Acidimicrobiia bacterium]|nr:hypothetical protein [Acidimicrobiia bacterium]
MANARKKKSGRTAPRGGGSPGRATPKRPPAATDRPVQPGKRPSNPMFLLAVGLVWIACGVYAIAALSASWKLIPGIFFIGVGILFLRGTAMTFIRQQRRRERS